MHTTTVSLTTFLRRLDACDDAVAWAQQFDGSPEAAWQSCHRGNWMLWLLGQFAGEPDSDARKRLVLCACECARLAPPIKRAEWEQARLNCLDVTEQWARGEGATIEEVRKVRAAAADAAAADAARAVWSADAAARAAGDCATYAAIVRRHIPLAVVACARVGARDPLPLTPR